MTLAQAAKVMKLHKNIIPFTIKHHFKFHNTSHNFFRTNISINNTRHFTTFEDMQAKMKLKCRSGELIKGHINPQLVFRRALTLTKFREDVSVQRVLSYPIGPVPTSLFHDDVTMRICNKSDLAKELESVVGEYITGARLPLLQLKVV